MTNKYWKIISIFVFCSFLINGAFAQSFWFGPKGGLSLGTQNSGSSFSQPLVGGHIAFFMESYNEEENSGSLYSSIGLHQRGSSRRSFLNSWDNIRIPGINYVYNNLSLQLGIKKMTNNHFYYMVGIRGEYTLYTNLDKINSIFISPSTPQNEFVRPFTAGISGGAGYQYTLSDLYGIAIEFSVHPDFFRQYYSPELPNVISPTTGNTITLREQEIRNTTLELSVSMRFLRKVEYY